MREVRFFSAPSGLDRRPANENNWAGTGPNSELPFWTVRAMVEGQVDPRTGYLCDIKILDDLVRRHLAVALRATRSLDESNQALSATFGEIAAGITGNLRLSSLELRYSPFTTITVCSGALAMLVMTQSFEFSASHRLACPGLSDEENYRLFGKCSNPHGHGHNYVLEVSASASDKAALPLLPELDRIVRREIIERFDHKNLNVECAEFANLNPTVENIAQVIFDRLETRLETGRLTKVRVWETAKTYAECLSASETSPGPTR